MQYIEEDRKHYIQENDLLSWPLQTEAGKSFVATMTKARWRAFAVEILFGIDDLPVPDCFYQHFKRPT